MLGLQAPWKIFQDLCPQPNLIWRDDITCAIIQIEKSFFYFKCLSTCIMTYDVGSVFQAHWKISPKAPTPILPLHSTHRNERTKFTFSFLGSLFFVPHLNLSNRVWRNFEVNFQNLHKWYVKAIEAEHIEGPQIEIQNLIKWKGVVKVLKGYLIFRLNGSSCFKEYIKQKFSLQCIIGNIKP